MCPLHPETPSLFPPHPMVPGCHRASALDAWLHISNSHWLSILHVDMFQCYSLKSSHPLLVQPSPKICSLCLCLLCCPIHRIVGTIFLDSICIYINIWYLCFSFWLISLCIIDSRVFHLIRTDSNVFLFYTWVILHSVSVSQLPYPSRSIDI